MLNRIKKIQTQIGLMHNEVEQLKAIGESGGLADDYGCIAARYDYLGARDVLFAVVAE